MAIVLLWQLYLFLVCEFLCLLSSFSTEASMEVAFHEAAMEWHYSNSEWNSQTSGFWLLGVCKRYRGTPVKGTSMLYN